MSPHLRCKLLAALLAGVGASVAVDLIRWNVASDRQREMGEAGEPKASAEPDPTPLRDKVAEARLADAAGQAAIVAGEQPTVEFPALGGEYDEAFCGRHRISFQGTEDVR